MEAIIKIDDASGNYYRLAVDATTALKSYFGRTISTVGEEKVRIAGSSGSGAVIVRPDAKRDVIVPPYQGGLSMAAKELAKCLGIQPSVSLAEQIVKQKIGDHLGVLSIDGRQDPDEDDYCTICFNVRFRGSVDEALAVDEAVQAELNKCIPAKDLVHLSLNYTFE